MSQNDMEPFSESLDDVFARLGLPDPVLISQILEEWDELAGKPWVGRSKPLYVKGKTLVVEASAPSMIAFLRYGESSLVEALRERFGEGRVEAVEVIAPGRG
jgi:hypothetical protein